MITLAYQQALNTVSRGSQPTDAVTTVSIELRPHQKTAVDALRASLRSGHKRPVLAAPCSMGKTHIAAYILMNAVEKNKHNPDYRAVFFVDRLKLLSQTTDVFDSLGASYSVMQGDDPRYDLSKPIQIVSIQTALRRKSFGFDIAVVDECHTLYKGVTELMRRLNGIPWIGLSATPYSKSMSAEGLYDDLIVTCTPRDMIDEGWLTPTEYYVGRSVDSSGIKTKALSTGGSDYDPKALGQKMLDDDTLAGDIVQNYVKHSNGLTRRALCFAPSIAYSKSLVDRFNAEIGSEIAVHVDGYMDRELQNYIFEDFKRGDYKILVNSKLTNTGFDDTGIEIIIDAYKTKSRIAWIQRIGRCWRIHAGKEKATVLDHAGNLQHFNTFPEDIIPHELDSGDRRFDEKKQTKQEEKEPIVRPCPVCRSAMTGRRCKACGHVLPSDVPVLKDNGEMLVKAEKPASKLTSAAVRREKMSKTGKQAWYSTLLLYAKQKNYKHGWAYWKYKESMDCSPAGLRQVVAKEPLKEALKWIQSENIRYSHRRHK